MIIIINVDYFVKIAYVFSGIPNECKVSYNFNHQVTESHKAAIMEFEKVVKNLTKELDTRCQENSNLMQTR